MSHLIKYEGKECTHCQDMEPVVQQLESETGAKVTRKEVYHNAQNQKEYMEDAKDRCQGVPFFINKKNGKYICGTAPLEKLKEWAKD